jgi:hypothetical protein
MDDDTLGGALLAAGMIALIAGLPGLIIAGLVAAGIWFVRHNTPKGTDPP